MAVCAAQVLKVDILTIHTQSEYGASCDSQNELCVGVEVLRL
jgi:hypothetical protein